MLLFSGVVISSFLSIVLIGKKRKTQADWILFCWLMTVVINLILYNFQENNTIIYYPLIIGWIFPIPLLYWPYLYLYITALTSKNKLQKKYLLHFLPFILSVLMFFSFYIMPSQTKIEIFKKKGTGYELEMNANLIAVYLSAIIYTIVSIRKLNSYSKEIKKKFSSIKKINLYWIQYLILGMTIIFFIIIFRYDPLIYYAVTAFIIFIGYFGIKQAGIFSHNNFELNHSYIEHLVFNPETIKYEKSTLLEESALKIQKELNSMMSSKKVFKNPELTLDDLAIKLNVQPNHLSQVINSLENKTFYEYINHFRIEEFCSLINNSDNQKFTLLAIAFECGFNSKSSFNRNFKNTKGLTPSEYLKQISK